MGERSQDLPVTGKNKRPRLSPEPSADRASPVPRSEPALLIISEFVIVKRGEGPESVGTLWATCTDREREVSPKMSPTARPTTHLAALSRTGVGLPTSVQASESAAPSGRSPGELLIRGSQVRLLPGAPPPQRLPRKSSPLTVTYKMSNRPVQHRHAHRHAGPAWSSRQARSSAQPPSCRRRMTRRSLSPKVSPTGRTPGAPARTLVHRRSLGEEIVST